MIWGWRIRRSASCIVYATSCSLSDHDLADRYAVLQRTGGQSGLEREKHPHPSPPQRARGQKGLRHPDSFLRRASALPASRIAAPRLRTPSPLGALSSSFPRRAGKGAGRGCGLPPTPHGLTVLQSSIVRRSRLWRLHRGDIVRKVLAHRAGRTLEIAIRRASET